MKLVISLFLLSTVSAFAEGGGMEAPYKGADYSTKYPAGCTEGARVDLLETSDNDTLVRVTYVCRQNRLVPLRGVEARPSVTACRNGSRTVILEQDYASDASHPVAYVCRAGKWVRN